MHRLLLLFVLASCGPGTKTGIKWENNRASEVYFGREMVFSETIVADSFSLRVHNSPYNILGTTTVDRDITFTPSVSLERGQSYDAYYAGKKFYTLDIPVDPAAFEPVLQASYPSCDTVPANLLKVYLQFTEPMMEARSAQFVQLFDAKGDTVKNAFLDLQPELWNEDGTVLTLWLDPGRIKQDLIPNKELGTVLNENSRYTLRVAKGWRSKAGLPLQADYERSYVTAGRDVKKPDMPNWSVIPPAANATGFVTIDFKETLDWTLLNVALTVWSEKKAIKGRFTTDFCERTLRFEPYESWKSGTYNFLIEPRIEDLAGNNLHRLFETEVTDDPEVFTSKAGYTLPFTVK